MVFIIYLTIRSIEQWIRAKYERKQFAASKIIPDPDSLLNIEASLVRKDLVKIERTMTTSATPKPNNFSINEKVSSSPLDDLFSAFENQSQDKPIAPKTVDLKSNILSLYSNPPPANSRSVTMMTPATMASESKGFANFADFSQFATFSKNESFSNLNAKNDANLNAKNDFDFFSQPESFNSPAKHRQNSTHLLDIESISLSTPAVPNASTSNPLEIDFSSFSISKTEPSILSSTSQFSSFPNGFASVSKDPERSSISQKVNPALVNHWSSPDPSFASSPSKDLFSLNSIGVSNPSSNLMDSSMFSEPSSQNQANTQNNSHGINTNLPVSTATALDFVDPWSEFQ